MNPYRSDHKPLRRRLPKQAAPGLGWFSIGLGVAELLMPRLVARATGMHGSETLLRLYGMRQIATGIGILSAPDPKPWVWGRVAGDALDLLTLGAHAGPHNPHRMRTCTAMGVVAAVTAADAACAQGLSHRPLELQRDYSDRSGLPRPPEQMRGAALEDFRPPVDMRTPEPLRPYAVH